MSYLEKMLSLAKEGDLQGVWFVAAIYMLAVGLYSLQFQFRTRHWPSTKGELVGLGLTKFGANELNVAEQDYMSKALYNYSVAGKEYQGTRVSPWVIIASYNAQIILKKQLAAIQHYPDNKVDVFYNAKKPHKSYLLTAGIAGICVTVVVTIAPMLLYYVRFYT